MEKYHCSQVWMEKKWLGYSTSLPLCFGVEGHCFQLKKLLQPTLGFGLALETRFPFGLVIDPLPTNFLIYALLELLQQTSVSTGCQESKWLAPAKDRPCTVTFFFRVFTSRNGHMGLMRILWNSATEDYFLWVLSTLK